MLRTAKFFHEDDFVNSLKSIAELPVIAEEQCAYLKKVQCKNVAKSYKQLYGELSQIIIESYMIQC